MHYAQRDPNYRMPLKSVNPICHLRTTPGYLMSAEQSLDIAISFQKWRRFSKSSVRYLGQPMVILQPMGIGINYFDLGAVISRKV